MLSDDVAEKGYALLCMAMPQTDCKIMTVSEVCASRGVGWRRVLLLAGLRLAVAAAAGLLPRTGCSISTRQSCGVDAEHAPSAAVAAAALSQEELLDQQLCA